MRRNTSPVLVVLLALCSAVALLHVSIALGSSHPFGDSPRTTQSVRSYYASLNSFLAGGDLEDLGDADLVLQAVRATYPNLRLEPSGITGSGDLALAQVTAVDGESALPSWINEGIGPAFPSAIDSLRFENDQIVERQTSARTGVLAQPLAGAGVDFRLDSPSHLKVAELLLSELESRSAYVSVSGPGFVLPLDESFTVEGNGLLQVTGPLDGTDRHIQPGEMAVIAEDEILVIPRGQAVLRPAGETRPRMMLLTMIPTRPEPRDLEANEGARGPESLDNVLRRLASGDTAERIWFGTVRLIASTQDVMQPGWLSMDVTRIVVPTGETLRLSSQQSQMIPMMQSDDGWTEIDSFETTNGSNSLWMLETVRACWRGVGYLPVRACSVQAGKS